MNVGEYIKKLRTDYGYSQEQLGSMIGVKRAAVQKWESGKVQNLKRETIKKLSEIFNVPPSTFVDENSYSIIYDNIIPLPKTKMVPLVGTIACGTPILAEENIESMVSMPEHIHADFALRCKGDSMINARILDNDIVYIRKQDTVENGEIAAVLIDNEATLKRFYRYGDTVVLRAENPNFKEIEYKKEELNSLKILGKAVYFLSKVN